MKQFQFGAMRRRKNYCVRVNLYFEATSPWATKTGSDHGSGLGLYGIRTQEVTHRGELRDYLEGWEGPGSCPGFFNVRIFTYRVKTLHIYFTRALHCHVIPTH